MDFQQAEQFLYSLANIPRKEYMKSAGTCEEYLPRVKFFLDILGNPEKKISHFIHVTGTSGKGSTVNFLHSILQQAGKRVASTTSPHPTLVTERWKVGNICMSKKEFVEIIEELKPKLDEYIRTSLYELPSYFEMTTIIALYYFAKKNVDWAILEVGCGGMYDATNVIPHKDVAVITNIGLDHTDLLGKTKSAIAVRKAGIITGKTHVFTTEHSSMIRSIIKKQADKTQSSFSYVNKNMVLNIQEDLSGTSFQYSGHSYKTSAIGTHQALNASLAIDIATSLEISQSTIAQGVAKVQQPLRMEVISHTPLIIIDGAHNNDKVQSTVRSVTQAVGLDRKNTSVHIICGFSGDKDLKHMINDLATVHPTTVACTRNTINHFRKVAHPSTIQKIWKTYSPKTQTDVFLNPADALAWTKKRMKKHDILLITGSIFLSSEIKELLS